jgi:hypothetical protein
MVRVYGEGYMWSFLGMGVWWVFFSVRELALGRMVSGFCAACFDVISPLPGWPL